MPLCSRVITIGCDMLPKRVGNLKHLRGASRSMVGRVSHLPVSKGCNGRISRQIFRIQGRAAYKLVNDRFKDLVREC